MTKVRLGIIGLGNIGQYYAGLLRGDKVRGAELVAVSTRARVGLEAFADLKTYPDGEDLIRSGEVDAVILATPHYQHTTLGIAALKEGLHVLVEKPISAHKADAERLIAAHERTRACVFAAVFQLRAEPRYAKMRQLVRDGELGQVVRVNWVTTDWYRTDAYYANSGWRATWKGEGGGVLLNQCPHNLDLLQWIVGQPNRVRGFCQLGRFHPIEVEDSVTAYLEYSNGAAGTFVASTGEAPGTNRFEIAGSLGKVVLEHGKLLFTRNAVDMVEFSRTASLGFAKPDAQEIEIPFENVPDSHGALVQNFVNAILGNEPLIAPAAEGLPSLELANAILYSSLSGQTVELPLDSAIYERKLQELIAGSKARRSFALPAYEDVAGSFRK
jgi:predicted dehydrogenase